MAYLSYELFRTGLARNLNRIILLGLKNAVNSLLARVAFLPLLLVTIAVSGCTPEYTQDEFFIRGHLRIPTDVQMVSFFASPEEPSRFFGRENLIIRAKFKFKDQKQFDDFLFRVNVTQTWNVLPVPDRIYMRMEEIDRFHQADLKQIDGMKDGYFQCETSMGNGFMKPSTTFVKYPPQDPDKDFLIAAADTEALELYVALKQDY